MTITSRIAMLGALLACGCSGPPAQPPGALEIGIHDEEEGTFVPLQDGDTVAVVLGSNGLNMVVPSLRVEGADPRGPEPNVEVFVGGVLMAADIEGDRVDLVVDDAGRGLLRDLRVPFQTDLCCYVCRDGTLRARLEDRKGRVYEGEVTVQLERGGCPDPSACCASASACPDPDLTQVCE